MEAASNSVGCLIIPELDLNPVQSSLGIVGWLWCWINEEDVEQLCEFSIRIKRGGNDNGIKLIFIGSIANNPRIYRKDSVKEIIQFDFG